jgi:hypothetical protein
MMISAQATTHSVFTERTLHRYATTFNYCRVLSSLVYLRNMRRNDMRGFHPRE